MRRRNVRVNVEPRWDSPCVRASGSPATVPRKGRIVARPPTRSMVASVGRRREIWWHFQCWRRRPLPPHALPPAFHNLAIASAFWYALHAESRERNLGSADRPPRRATVRASSRGGMDGAVSIRPERLVGAEPTTAADRAATALRRARDPVEAVERSQRDFWAGISFCGAQRVAGRDALALTDGRRPMAWARRPFPCQMQRGS